jgi:hypothetical protein
MSSSFVFLKSYGWQSHCRGLYQTPIAAGAGIRHARSAWPLLRPVKEIARSVFRFNAKNANLALKWKMFQMILHFSE